MKNAIKVESMFGKTGPAELVASVGSYDIYRFEKDWHGGIVEFAICEGAETIGCGISTHEMAVQIAEEFRRDYIDLE